MHRNQFGVTPWLGIPEPLLLAPHTAQENRYPS
jgi:hypothetical protein